MKLSHFFLAFTLLNSTAVISAENKSTKWQIDTKLALGSKQIKDAWENIDEHGAIGFFTSIQQKNWPVAIAIDLLGTGKEKTLDTNKNENHTAELNIGARYYFQQAQTFIPYIGGGITYGYAETKQKNSNTTEKFDGNDIGYWLNLGVDMHLSKSFTVGVDYRKSSYNITLNTNTLDAGGDILTFTAGYRF